MTAKSKLIFVVDDDEMLRSMLSFHLQKNPLHVVQTYSTGEECMRDLRQNPDVIVLDYQLNSKTADAKDGLEILQQIKKVDRDVFVIMLSSQSHYGKAAQTVAKGALEYVVKDKDAFKRIEGIIEEL